MFYLRPCNHLLLQLFGIGSISIRLQCHGNLDSEGENVALFAFKTPSRCSWRLLYQSPEHTGGSDDLGARQVLDRAVMSLWILQDQKGHSYACGSSLLQANRLSRDPQLMAFTSTTSELTSYSSKTKPTFQPWYLWHWSMYIFYCQG